MRSPQAVSCPTHSTKRIPSVPFAQTRMAPPACESAECVSALVGSLALTTSTLATEQPKPYRFVCPESLPDDRSRAEAVMQFLYWAKSVHPELTTEEKLVELRHSL